MWVLCTLNIIFALNSELEAFLCSSSILFKELGRNGEGIGVGKV